MSAETPLTFFLVAADDRFAHAPACFSTHNEAAPSVLLHGTSQEGCSVLLHVHGFLPYFYAEKPAMATVASCRQAFETLRRGASPVVAHIEEVTKWPLMGFHAEAKSFLRITLTSPSLVAACRTSLEKGLRLPQEGIVWRSPAFEANVPYTLRFLVDNCMGGGSWVEVPGGRFQLRDQRSRVSTAQIEADAHVRVLKSHRPEGEWLRLPPLRLLTLHFCTAGVSDGLAAGAATLQVQGENTPHHQAIWMVAPSPASRCARVAEAEVFSFCNERELLQHLHEYILTVDPDIILGYDVLNGHLSDILGRAKALGLPNFGIGRMRGTSSHVKKITFETRQLGKHETKEINADGRLLFDVLTIMEREQKLSSYSLSFLVYKFMGEVRLELRPSTVRRLAREDPLRLAQLALKDAGRVLQVFQSNQCLVRYVEMARVTGVPIEYLLKRGQSVKVHSMLLRKARNHDYVLPPPTTYAHSEATYEGGAVLEPIAGFYDEPIVTLDFASLYPSIMQCHNLCYCTLIPAGPIPSSLEARSDEAFETVPIAEGYRFVTSRVRKGLLPMVLEELLTARAAAKKAMKAAQDPQLRAILDAKQLALKVSANSVYGFTGMSVGTLPCQAIAASVTAYGRQMIERTTKVVEAKFCKSQGYSVDAKVIYGDTDSVMVSLGPHFPLTQAFKFGAEAADIISKEFGAPVKMEFEKIYFPFLLMNKKRYAGLTWNCPEEAGKLDTKGIEVVRRDWCELVRQVADRCLNLLLRERSVERAVAHVQGVVADLRQGRIDTRLLVLSKGFAKDDYAAKQAHVELAEKLRQRDPATAPQIGDRISYVFTAAASGTPGHQRAEDPRYALEHDMPIDGEYYIEHQLKAPLLRIFEPVVGESANVLRQLFAGDHSRHRARASPVGAGPLAKYAVKRAKCLGCKTLLPSAPADSTTAKALCLGCAEPSKAQRIWLSHLNTLRPLEEEARRLFSQCVRCEGSALGKLHMECVNVDCPIFFRRFQVARELDTTQAALQKLSLDW
jgi:DNA polymerase delta subunit 1